MSHLLATKDDMKTNKTPNQPKGESGGPYSPMAKNSAGGPPGAGAPGGDRNTIKVNLNLAVDIVHTCFNLDAPKSV